MRQLRRLGLSIPIMHYLSETLSWLGYLMKLKEGLKMMPPKQSEARILMDSDADMHLAHCNYCDWRYLTDNKKGAWQLGSEHLFLAHGLKGKENNAYNSCDALKRRAKTNRFDFNLTDQVGSTASQQPAAAGQPAASKPDLPEARLNSYPQIHAHVDNL